MVRGVGSLTTCYGIATGLGCQGIDLTEPTPCARARARVRARALVLGRLWAALGRLMGRPWFAHGAIVGMIFEFVEIIFGLFWDNFGIILVTL